MACNIVTVLDRRDSDCRVVFDGFADCVESVFEVVLVEEPEEAPDAGAGAVVVFGLDVDGSFADLGCASGGFPEMGFGVDVTVQDSVFGTLNGLGMLKYWYIRRL